MTVRVERGFEVSTPRADVWEFIADPRERASAISVVESYEITGTDGTWHVSLPIPVVDSTLAIDTREEQRRPPEYVRFVGTSRAVHVLGEHELDAVADGTRLTNRFVVESSLPGVERFFRRNLDDEIDNLQLALRERLDDAP